VVDDVLSHRSAEPAPRKNKLLLARAWLSSLSAINEYISFHLRSMNKSDEECPPLVRPSLSRVSEKSKSPNQDLDQDPYQPVAPRAHLVRQVVLTVEARPASMKDPYPSYLHAALVSEHCTLRESSFAKVPTTQSVGFPSWPKSRDMPSFLALLVQIRQWPIISYDH